MTLPALIRFALVVVCVFAVQATAQPAAAPPQQTEAAAQPTPPDRKPSDDEKAKHDRPDPDAMSDDEIRELVSTIIMVRISRNLELNDEQTVLLVRHLQDMREEMSALFRERERVFKEMRELNDKADATDDEIDAKLHELMAVDEKRSDAKRRVFEKASEGMTTKQRAKLYVTLQEFEWQMRRLIQRAKEMSDDQLKKMRDEWSRGMSDGDGPKGPMDRPMVKQFLKSRFPDGAPEKQEPPKPAPKPE